MGNELKIVILGTPQLLQKLAGFKDFIRSPKMRSILESAANTLVPVARSLVPRRSYTLHHSINARVEDFGSENPKIIFGASAKYASAVETGTKANYPIMPKNGKWLRWTTQGPRGNKIFTPPGIAAPEGLTEVWRKRVIHPGIKAHPYFRPAIDKVRPRLLAAMHNALNKIAQGGGTGE